ncbi:MAG: radical SAM protein [Actinomycetes bacterium]
MPATRHETTGGETAQPSLTPASVVASFDDDVGAYVHVPFCEWICPFCPYNKVLADEHLADRYFAALKQEVGGYVTALTAARSKPFTSLYVGGGTPTLYPNELADVVSRIPVSGERAIEVLPTHGTSDRLAQLADIGFTAVSIGAQSFHDGVLRRLHRPHDAATSRAAVENALGLFGCLDVDLIVDVEWEDEDAYSGAFLDDVRTCFGLEVDQVSTYPLMRFGYTPFGTAGHDRRREHAVLAQVSSLADSMGYERRSVWTFNRRGARPYSSITRRRFIGMGAGSSSFAGRDFFVNHFGVATYADAVERDVLPVARWLHLGRWAGAAYDAFWQAYAGGVDVGSVANSYGSCVAWLVHAGLAPLTVAGLTDRSPDGYRLTPRGFDAYHDLERAVTYQLIEPLWAEMLTEHAQERPVECSPSRPPQHWARPQRARAGRAWTLARRLFERRSWKAGSIR